MAVPAYKILSVGGSIIIPPTGFDIIFLKKFRDLITSRVKKGERFILVIGGGGTARQYQAAGKGLGLKNIDLDWVGIHTTILNAEFVRIFFGKLAHSEVVRNPTKKVSTSKPIIIASGWVPGCSTDKDAVLFAKTYGAKEVVNLSNVDYIYDADPRHNPRAKKQEALTWAQLLTIIGEKWSPGANLPFDPMAAKEAKKIGLTVRFARGNNIMFVKKVLAGEQNIGTVIS